ncbi:class I SAM-dependent methyltransferase [Idiomarina sp. HP20-50]|uniref:class I SAM-dependent methyltransferase n=1 Tax=Idiomarina sp. HP20-50 TaxID=3070813 RepID=UPI00294AB2FF|nr:class I SAM-dependent methyltransferase [Idiomarina sp. HP20-50]MDV6316626.1 class I SAM-dependent methyltransferase [Idiomarina sp. HP20-50]
MILAPVLSEPECADAAAEIAARWGLPTQSSKQDTFQLWLREGVLALHWLESPQKMSPLVVDFHQGKAAYRAQHTQLKNEAIAKAVGVGGKLQPSVLDATAGLGRDAFVLAGLGCDLQLIERHPVVAALLDNGLQRAQQEADFIGETCQRMHLIGTDNLFTGKGFTHEPDVVYLDPMYPKTGKQKAQVKKDMQMFQQLVGSDEDADNLLEPSIARAKYRVVVKRPNSAPFLAEREPNSQIKSKKHRFDVYIKRGFNESTN